MRSPSCKARSHVGRQGAVVYFLQCEIGDIGHGAVQQDQFSYQRFFGLVGLYVVRGGVSECAGWSLAVQVHGAQLSQARDQPAFSLCRAAKAALA